MKPKFAKVINIVEEKNWSLTITHISEKDYLYLYIYMYTHMYVYNMEAGDEQDIYTRNYGSRNSETSGSAVSHLYSLEFWRLKEHESQFPASSSLRVEDQYPILKIFWEEENLFLGSSFVQNLNKLGEAPHFAKGCELYSTQWFKWKPHLE